MSTNHNFPQFLQPDSFDFPDSSLALDEPNGLLAIGGDLSMQRLLSAYKQGIFPWFSHGEPIMWWTPNPRSIILIDEYKPSKSLLKLEKKNHYKLTHNEAFNQVIQSCSHVKRKEQNGTWITDEMIFAYQQLHNNGIAHSFECWRDDKLVGGLYGIMIDKVFFGESMFSIESNTSKLSFKFAVDYCKNNNIQLIDCQVESEHMNSLGAKNISRDEFQEKLKELISNHSYVLKGT